MKTQKILGRTVVAAAAALFTLLGLSPVQAQQNWSSRHHREYYNGHSQAYWRTHYSSNVYIGGSAGSWSGYNNHPHHNLAEHRKYYYYQGSQYYIDLDTGFRIKV